MRHLPATLDVLSRYALVPMTRDHLDAVLEVEHRSYSNPWPREAFEHEIRRNPVSWARVLVTISEPAELAGYCVVWLVFEHLHIQNLAVHPHHRRAGLGRFLLRSALAEGVRQNAATALLEVRRSNLAARRLYRETGFLETGVRKGYYSMPREDAILYQRPLDPAR